jgi:hypothetical protein
MLQQDSLAISLYSQIERLSVRMLQQGSLFFFLVPKDSFFIWLSNIFVLSVPFEMFLLIMLQTDD